MGRKIIFGFGFALIILGIGYSIIFRAEECKITAKEVIVRGNSLSGLIEDGENVNLLLGYYKCNEIKREDIVVYRYGGSSNNLIKVVKGVPGDSFHLEKVEGGWNILINGQVVKNSKGLPYIINDAGYKMLSLYENDYKGKIPKDAYLLLGNLTGGSLDSTRFGLVGKGDIIGKVER